MHTIRALASATVMALLLALVGPGLALAGDDLEPVGGTPTVVVTISGSGVSPRDARIEAGDVVEFRNRDATRHRLRTQSGPARFDTSDLDPGQSVRFRFVATGTYAYADERDGDDAAYQGRVVVQATSTGGGSTGGGSTGGGSTGGGSTGGGGTGGGGTATGATISIGDDFFSPTSVRIAVGGTVTFRNVGGDEHTATSTGGGPIDSGVLGAGGTHRASFPTAGTFPFLCIFHSDMRGTVTVVGGDGASAPAPGAVPAPGAEPPATSAPSTIDQGTAAPRAVTVDAADLVFRPATVRVAAGGSVTWTNVGQAPHTVTAEDGLFDSGLLATGGTYTRTFATAGRYAYVCTLHPGMAGTVDVALPTSTAGAAPTASAGAGAPGITPGIEPGESPAAPPAPTDGTTGPGLPEPPPPGNGADPASVSVGSGALDAGEIAGIIVACIAVSVAVGLFARLLAGTVRAPAGSD